MNIDITDLKCSCGNIAEVKANIGTVDKYIGNKAIKKELSNNIYLYFSCTKCNCPFIILNKKEIDDPKQLFNHFYFLNKKIEVKEKCF
jgi:hypothetical protein